MRRTRGGRGWVVGGLGRRDVHAGGGAAGEQHEESVRDDAEEHGRQGEEAVGADRRLAARGEERDGGQFEGGRRHSGANAQTGSKGGGNWGVGHRAETGSAEGAVAGVGTLLKADQVDAGDIRARRAQQGAEGVQSDGGTQTALPLHH